MAIGMKDDDLDSMDTKEVVSDLSGSDTDSTVSKNKNMLVIVIVAIIVIIIIGMVKSIMSPKDEIKIKDTDVTTEASGNQSIGTNNNTANGDTNSIAETTDSGMAVGLPEFDDKTNGTTSATVYSASDYIKDLNGLDTPAVYTVVNRQYVRDFVNYEAKRAILADGMEMYWLEITYKNKPYRCQIPFYIFKDLEDVGICVVEIELLTLEGGEQIISFMQVVSDYSDLINQ